MFQIAREWRRARLVCLMRNRTSEVAVSADTQGLARLPEPTGLAT